MLKGLIRKILDRSVYVILSVAGRAYVPGWELKHAQVIARRLVKQNIACTFGHFYQWHHIDRADNRERIKAISRDMVNAVADLQPPGYISVRVPAFNFDAGILADIVEIANQREVLVHFDSHGNHLADATLRCVQQAVELKAAVGLTIPGRWRRSLADVDLACQLGLRVRVVKGEWLDPQAPDMDLRVGFLQVIERLAGRAKQVAVASHDPWLVRESIMRLQAAGTHCEIELLNGLPQRRILALANEFGVPVRVYIPFGMSWRPYALSKAIANPRIMWWVMRDTLIGLVSSLR